MSQPHTSPLRQWVTFAAISFAMLLCVFAICIAIPYLSAFRNARRVQTSWSRFEADTSGSFLAGAAALLEDGGVIYSTPLRGRGDIVAQKGESISPVVASVDQTELQPSLATAGTQLVFVREYESRATLWMADVTGSNARQITAPPPLGRDYFPRFVGGDTSIRFQRWYTTSGNASNGELREVVLATGQDVLLEPNCEDISADGRLMCCQVPPKLQITVSNRDGSNPKVFGQGGYPRFSPDGRFIVFVGSWSNPGLHLVNLHSGEVRRLCSIPGYPSPPQFTSDGKRIAVTWGNGQQAAFWLVDTVDGQVVEERLLPFYRTSSHQPNAGGVE
jgi:hypothetical protein